MQRKRRTMPTTRTTGRLLTTTTTRTTRTRSFLSSLVAKKGQGECVALHDGRTVHFKEYVTIDEVFDAYYDCRKHKRSKRSAVEYELNYELNNYDLWVELNSMTYRPTTSIAFCVTKPRLREVFAADFRDRVVHHLFIKRIHDAVERRLTDRAFACRIGKGTLFGARKVAEMMGREEEWYVKCDIEGFFMSIDKEVLMGLVEEVVRESVKENVDWWLWLARVIVMHRPERDCEIHGNPKLWDDLPDNKTLFKTDGMPIGNLPSQVLANLYLAEFDRWVIERVGEKNYARYVDDWMAKCESKGELVRLLRDARRWLWEKRRLSLHKRKVCIQKTRRGVGFTGYFIKNGVIHAGKRMRGRAVGLCEKWSERAVHSDEERVKLRDSYNSYCGLLKHTASWRVRRKMWRRLGEYEGLVCVNMEKIETSFGSRKREEGTQKSQKAQKL